MQRAYVLPNVSVVRLKPFFFFCRGPRTYGCLVFSVFAVGSAHNASAGCGRGVCNAVRTFLAARLYGLYGTVHTATAAFCKVLWCVARTPVCRGVCAY